MLPFTLDELKQAVEDKWVTARNHPYLPYTIYNYAPEVQWLNKWNDITLNCRGLILDGEGRIVARPWKKFFNLGQVDLPIQFDTPVEVMDKVDGSLGILYPGTPGATGRSWAIATRGSFESEQAIHATDTWNDKYAADYNPVVREFIDYTFLFEIIYPENRIVLDYKGMDDLVLLGAVQKSTGYYLGPNVASAFLDWHGPTVKVFEHKNLSEALGDTARPNAEGFVIRSHNFLVKVKQPDYVELHRLVTNVSPKSVWEQLRAGKSRDEIISNFPDEFHEYVDSMVEPLLTQYDKRVDEILEVYSECVGKLTKQGVYPDNRKKYAAEFSKHKDKPYFFLILDGKGIHELLWKELRPRDES